MPLSPAPGGFAALLAFVVILASAGLCWAAEPVTTEHDDITIMTEAEDVDRFLEVPFELASIPEKAEFDMAFRVKTTGICPGTLYEPTRIWINRKSVASLNFRDRYSAGELVRYKFEVPAKKLRVGENMLKIRMGSCKKGADTIVLNDIKVLQAPTPRQQAAKTQQ